MRQIILKNNTNLKADENNTRFIHIDVIEIIEDFIISTKSQNIKVKTINLYKNK